MIAETERHAMLHVVQVETDAHRQQIRELLREYFLWLRMQVNRENDPDFDVDAFTAEAVLGNSKFAPPDGRLLLAQEDGEAAGVIALRKIDSDTGEVKRLYVRSTFRGRGIGLLLVERLCDEARAAGYAQLRLDSGPFMKAAHRVYRAAGFHDRIPYPESEVPSEYYTGWVFMEMTL